MAMDRPSYYGVGLTFGIAAPCLAWEGIMYLREKRRREKAEAFAAAVNAKLQREREAAEAAKAQLQERVSALENELRTRAQAEVINAQLQNEVGTLRNQVTHLSRELDALKARSQSDDAAE